MSRRPVPPRGELRVAPDVAEAFTAIVEEVAAAAEDGRHVHVVLTGGETAQRCYERLTGSDRIEWSDLECYLGDERAVPPDDDAANQKMIRDTFVQNVPLAAFHPIDPDRPDDYDALVAGVAPFDLCHLDIGPDGHTASLFPHSPALESPPGRLVTANHDPLGNNPYERVTFTFEAIAASRLVVITASGEEKREALGRVLGGEDLPAARVEARRVIWLCDDAALGEENRGAP